MIIFCIFSYFLRLFPRENEWNAHLSRSQTWTTVSSKGVCHDITVLRFFSLNHVDTSPLSCRDNVPSLNPGRICDCFTQQDVEEVRRSGFKAKFTTCAPTLLGVSLLERTHHTGRKPKPLGGEVFPQPATMHHEEASRSYQSPEATWSQPTVLLRQLPIGPAWLPALYSPGT